MNRQNLQQKSGISSTIGTVQIMVKAMKIIRALNLRQKISNQAFVIIHIYILL